jgi:hypothetical protein
MARAPLACDERRGRARVRALLALWAGGLPGSPAPQSRAGLSTAATANFRVCVCLRVP